MKAKASHKSPAKVNLSFKVLKKRLDGYHEIETLMQVVSLCDDLHFSLSENSSITCTDPTIPTDGRNLIAKARDLFFEKTQICECVAIHLEKRIPHSAGLGGGSSNAATTLFSLNDLFGKPLAEKELIELGTKIGSDVPFFFSSGTALCKGRGEIIEDTMRPETLPTCIAKPKNLALSTPKVYSACLVGESLEPAAFRILPELKNIKAQLESVFENVFISGSGTAFICYGHAKGRIDANFDVFKIEPLGKKADEWYTPEYDSSI